MGKIIAGQYLSLDGVTESGWTGLSPAISPMDPLTAPYFNDSQVQQAVGELMAGNDAMLLGRTTYENLKGFFTSQSGPYFDAVNAMPKYVVSTTLESSDWNNTTVLRDNLVKEIGALKERHQQIGIGGSGTLVRWLIAENLLDELQLLFFPMILGGPGARFFTLDQAPATFTLTDCRPLDCGVVVLTYTRQDARA
ncbi:dihydrofolate reductase [Nocardia sp. ET3-3]|uniref:Dihydrofolate reductase n=1 Tax=Nocardia terrae TaxID=2675851 RepID=A0A7K1V8Z5_9NOCA|nr:dihydrofolate reductase family protein [Nocardia terrae]MVU83017.1 dihydrofolate reductase [Nocardia terrae]